MRFLFFNSFCKATNLAVINRRYCVSMELKCCWLRRGKVGIQSSGCWSFTASSNCYNGILFLTFSDRWGLHKNRLGKDCIGASDAPIFD